MSDWEWNEEPLPTRELSEAFDALDWDRCACSEIHASHNHHAGEVCSVRCAYCCEQSWKS